MYSNVVSEAQIAVVRGVINCGSHHEENKLAPAIEFVRVCDICAGRIFAIIWNEGLEAQARHLLGQMGR